MKHLMQRKHILLIVFLTSVSAFGCAKVASRDGSSDATASVDDADACVEGALVEGCQFPKPAGYPDHFLRDGIYHPNISTCPAGYVSGPWNPPFSGGCIRFDVIDAFASGFYKIYGQVYYDAFPIYSADNCATPINISGLTANVCF